MGFTGLARWQNAPTTGLDSVTENIVKNHHGQFIGRWQLSIRSYRSNFIGIPGLMLSTERSMFSLTMGENSFVLIDDPGAPSPREWIESYTASQNAANSPTTQKASPATASGDAAKPPIKVPPQPHYHYTFVTVRPPNALEHLLQQLRARWAFSRQTAQAQRTPLGKQGGQAPSLNIDGAIFALGKDWIVRIGNVNVSGGMKGMLLEAEYLPLPTLPTGEDHSSALVSNLLLSLLPMHADARTHSITLSDAQWKEVLHDTEAEAEDEMANEPGNIPKQTQADDTGMTEFDAEGDGKTDLPGPQVPTSVEDGDVYAYAEEADTVTNMRKGDWVSLERDRRSAFMIIMGLRSEGIV